MASTDLIVRLLGDTSDLKKDLNKATGTMAKFKKQAMQVGTALAGALAIGQIKSFAQESLKLYDIQAKAETKLLTALKGRTDVQHRLIQQAQTLQKSTLFGDEATLEAQAMLATLGLTEKQITELTPLVQDLSAATGKDLRKAAKEVTTAVATGSTTLEKYGVSLSTNNTLAENLKLTIDGLNNSVGGQAVAAANSGTGAITQLSNAFGDLQESIGKLIMSGGDTGIIGWLTDIVVAADNLVKAFDSAKMSQIMAAFGMAATGNLKAAFDALMNVKDAQDIQEKSLRELRSGYEEHTAQMIAAKEKAEAEAKAKRELDRANAAILASQQSEVGAVRQTIMAYADLSVQYEGMARSVDAVKIKQQELTQTMSGFFVMFQETGEATFTNMSAIMESFATNVLVGFAEDLGNAVAGVGNFGENILAAVGSFMKQLGAQMIQLGVAKAILDKLGAALPGGVLIAAGVALVAASQALKGTLDGGIGGVSSTESGGGGSSGISRGGAASPRGSIGLNAGTQKEQQQNEFTFRLEGDTLVAAIDKARRYKSVLG